MTDAFTTAARTEAEGTYNTHVYPGSASTWDQAIQRAAFTEGAEWARDHLAQQEPTDATALQERIEGAIVLSECGYNPVPLFVHERAYRLAAAVLPIIRKAQADAWQAGVNFALPSAETTHFARHNPHRTEEDMNTPGHVIEYKGRTYVTPPIIENDDGKEDDITHGNHENPVA